MSRMYVSDDAGVIRVMDGPREVLAYRYAGFDLYPYVHPVRLSYDASLTADAPGDHPWHHGMFFTLKYLNGYNLWDQRYSGHAWGTAVHRDISVSGEDGAGEIRIRHDLRWVADNGDALMDEIRVLRIARARPPFGMRIDWSAEMTMRVSADLDRYLPWGGYAGMSVRFPRSSDPVIRVSRLPGAEIDVSTGEGETTAVLKAGEFPGHPNYDFARDDGLSALPDGARSPWIDYSFWLDEIPAAQSFEHWVGWTVFDAPDNPSHPVPWLCYTAGNMRKLQAAFLRPAAMHLAKGESLRVAYRHLLREQHAPRNALEAEWRRYSANPPGIR